MEQSDHIEFEAETASPRGRPVLWVLRGMMVVCGTLMVLVILSQPRVTEGLQAGIAWLGGVTGGEGMVARADGESVPPIPELPQSAVTGSVPTGEAPEVRQMPSSQIPVHRGSADRED